MSDMQQGRDMFYPQERTSGYITISEGGLTKREWFAGMALSGFLANSNIKTSIDDSVVSRVAFEFADAMIEEGAK